MKKFILVTCLALGTQIALAEKPIGQTIHYKLDKGRVRTSTLISNARFALKIDSYDPQQGEFGTFHAEYKYDINVIFSGRKQGEGQTDVPGELYLKSFLERLRNEKLIVTEKYKIKHMGFEDAMTPVQTFVHTDKIFIYDIKSNLRGKDELEDNPLVSLFNDIAGNQSALPNIQDLKIQMNMGLVSDELEIVKLDLSGVVSGTSIKMGMDYNGFAPVW
ncbi:MAG: hypothetical protein KA436_01835 [Oligoflexales bacterium]|nr:hypothetical protein [Oligoflexales bacterium]